MTAAQTGKAPVQRLADRVAGVFVPIVIALSVATLGFWLGTGESATFAFTAAVAVLIIACPCALGLATPVALMVGTGRGAQLGLLIKGPEVLESTRRVDTIVLDKTGTVTSGQDVPGRGHRRRRRPAPGRLARALLRASIARAIAPRPRLRLRRRLHEPRRPRRRGRRRGTPRRRRPPRQFVDVPRGTGRGRRAAEARGHTAIVGGWDGEAHAVFVVADTVKPTSPAAIARLRALGLPPILLTGDNATTAGTVAERSASTRSSPR